MDTVDLSGWAAVALAAVAAAAAVPGSPTSPPPRRRSSAGSGAAAGSSPPLPMPVVAALGAGLATWALLTGVLGLVLGVASAAVTWRAVARMEPRAERRRRERLSEALPHVVDLMAACLAVGDSPGGALDRVASAVDDPMCSELRAVAARLRLGADSVAVWREVSRHPQLGPLGRCLLRATESGAPVSEAMTRLAEDVRRDSRAEVEARARAVGVRATAPLGVCLLPAFVVVGVVPLVAGSVSVLVLR